MNLMRRLFFSLLISGFVCLALPSRLVSQQQLQVNSVQWDPVGLGGTECVSGNGFGAASGSVILNGTNVIPSQWNDTQVCVVIPGDTSGGSAGLQLSSGDALSNVVTFTVTTAVPVVSGISPATAGTGIPVTITGTNFGSSEGNSLVQLQGLSFLVSSWSDTQIVATVPSGITPGGPFAVNVTINGVTVSAALTLVGAPQVNSVQWDPVGAGGTECVSGNGFGTPSGSLLLNGTNLIPSLWSNTQACFVIPPATAAGLTTLQVVNAAGPGNTANFTVTTIVPVISGISPATAGAGVPVTITGMNFGSVQGNSLVQMQGLSFPVSSWSDTQIEATVPGGITPGGPFTVNVTVNGVTASAGLTLVSAPQANSVQWDPVGIGGTECVSGASFGTASGSIILNEASLIPSQWSDTQACFVLPSATVPGPAALQVVNAGGPGNALSFMVTGSVPMMSGISPATAGVGIPVAITGVNFGGTQGNSLVQMQGVSFAVSSWSDAQIVATVPAGVTLGGPFAVNVTVNGVTVTTGLTLIGAPQLNSVQWDVAGVGGTECVNGTGFGSASGSVILNGASLIPSLWSDTQACFVIAPDTAAGAATLQVANAAGPSNALSFTVTTAVPVITGITPATAGAGIPVTITGLSFGSVQGNSLVQLQGVNLPVSNWSDTQIVAAVPSGISPGGPFSVNVTVNGVIATATLTIAALPQIAVLTPSSGAPGSTVMITGTGFGATPGSVNFAGGSASILNWNDNSITVTLPGGAFTGNVAVVTAAGLTSNALSFTVVSSNPTLDPDIVSRVSAIDGNMLSTSIQTLANFGTRNLCSNNSGGTSGIGAARDWISAQLAALPGMHTSLFNFNTTACGTLRTAQDVVAWIPGTGHPNRLIVIGGHYDSRTLSVTDGFSAAPGANDSGSQTALVLEAARVLAGGSYDATLVFVAWAGEEQGLLGSAAFVQNYHSLFPNGTIELNLNCDMVGGDNTANTGAALQQFRLFSPGTPREISTTAMGSTDNTSPSRLVMHYVGDWGSQYAPDMTMLPNLREDRPGRSGDHESFIAHAIPGVRFIDPAENLNHQHSPNDLFSFVTPSYTAGVARVVVAIAAALAQAATPPQSMSAALINSDAVQVSWSAPRSGPAVGHYVVSARAVTENFYRTRVVVDGGQTSVQVRIQEDLGIPAGVNFFVSVAAVDSAGHESIYAYPEYRCATTACVVPAGALNTTVTR